MKRNWILLAIALPLTLAVVALSQGIDMTPRSADQQAAELTEQVKVLNNRVAHLEDRVRSLEKQLQLRGQPAN